MGFPLARKALAVSLLYLKLRRLLFEASDAGLNSASLVKLGELDSVTREVGETTFAGGSSDGVVGSARKTKG